MKHIFKTQDISLKSLSLHPDNVRAGSGAGYSDEQIAPLAANIGECGLLQPLLVAPLPKGSDTQWGVLAGGRRLAALKMLAGDAAAKGFTVSMKVACRIVPESDAAQVTLSYSENALQLPMDALDRFEAFAAMQTRDHADVATIARTFAITERMVKEALRLGNIHGDIRHAHREGVLSLEALKAFDAHPDPIVQLAAFADLSDGNGGRIQPYAINSYFRGRFVRVGEALGQVVLEGYKAAGGVITDDLIAEDSVLEDSALIETVLHKVLSDAADVRCASLGLSWSDYLMQADYNVTSTYGRVYRSEREMTPQEQAQADKMALRMEKIEGLYEEVAENFDAEMTLRDEYDSLSDQIAELNTAYAAEDAGIGGVLAVWSGREITYHDGMVRPEDKVAVGHGGGVSDATGADATMVAVQDKWSEKLKSDMAHVRTRSVALALAQSPELARDYGDFTLIRSVMSANSYRYSNENTLRVEVGSRGPDVLAGSLKAIEEVFDTLSAGLEVEWLALDDEAISFAGFRALAAENRDQLYAFAVAQMLTPTLSRSKGSVVRKVVEAEALPNLRDVWTPDEAYFGRLTKSALSAILSTDLAMAEQAVALEKSKKSEVVTYLGNLFAAPFATLTDDQRQRVGTWCPTAMQTAVIEAEEGGVALYAGEPEAAINGEVEQVAA